MDYQTKLAVALLLEDESDDTIVDIYRSWLNQRGFPSVPLSTFNLWLSQYFPDKLGNVEQLYAQVMAKPAAPAPAARVPAKSPSRIPAAPVAATA